MLQSTQFRFFDSFGWYIVNSIPFKFWVTQHHINDQCVRKTSDKRSKVYSLTFTLFIYVYTLKWKMMKKILNKRRNSAEKKWQKRYKINVSRILGKQFSKNQDRRKSESRRNYTKKNHYHHSASVFYAARILFVFMSVFYWLGLGWVMFIWKLFYWNWSTNHSKRCFLTYQYSTDKLCFIYKYKVNWVRIDEREF